MTLVAWNKQSWGAERERERAAVTGTNLGSHRQLAVSEAEEGIKTFNEREKRRLSPARDCWLVRWCLFCSGGNDRRQVVPRIVCNVDFLLSPV